MKQAILVTAILLTCLAASMFPLRFIPVIVAISLGVLMMLHGLFAPRPILE